MKRSRVRITSPKKKKQEENNETKIDTFSTIATDVKAEILMRLSAKSVAKFTFVSKLWSPLIRSREFTDSYMNRSLSRPRILHSGGRYLFSCSHKDPSDDDHHQWLHLDRSYEFSPPVRGLICGHSDTKVLIANPTTRQLLTLPNLITTRIEILTFFGYDPVGDQYKVLCMTLTNFWLKRGSRDVSEQHQVFTLGAREPWRLIQCKHPHLPPYRTKGVCINGFVYYYAWINNDGSLISFDVRSELFDVIKLPEDVRLSDDFCNVVNYGGKIAFTTSQLQNGKLDLWVLEDATRSAWSKFYVVVPCWGDLVGKYTFRFKGALSTGELVFAPLFAFPFYVISYDLEENNAKKVVINGIGYCGHIEVFFDHIESPLLLS